MKFSEEHISAYLDGELSAEQLAEFEAALRDDFELRMAVEESRRWGQRVWNERYECTRNRRRSARNGP